MPGNANPKGPRRSETLSVGHIRTRVLHILKLPAEKWTQVQDDAKLSRSPPSSLSNAHAEFKSWHYESARVVAVYR